MPKHGKKYRAIATKVDRTKLYELDEAMALVGQTGPAKFDESVDVAIKLGVNPRHADQMVRGACVLPHGTGKTVRVVVFAKGDKIREAEEAGADRVGGDDMVDDIKKGWMEFDKAIATPDMMGSVGKIGRILGPRGLMPNPKVGTVTFEVGQAVREAKAGKIEFRVDKAGIIHAGVGKRSFDPQKLRENILALVEVLLRIKPATAKGQYVRGVAVATTMGPGIKMDPTQVQNALKG